MDYSQILPSCSSVGSSGDGRLQHKEVYDLPANEIVQEYSKLMDYAARYSSQLSEKELDEIHQIKNLILEHFVFLESFLIWEKPEAHAKPYDGLPLPQSAFLEKRLFELRKFCWKLVFGLDGVRYLFGEHITDADALLFAVLYNVYFLNPCSVLANVLSEFPSIREYFERITDMLTEEYDSD